MATASDLSKFELVVHSTREAGVKVGGVGAVLEGMLSSGSYLLGVERTLLVGPMNTRDDAEMERLVSPSNNLAVEYSSYHGLDKLERPLSAALGKIEAGFNVHILYGRREFDGTRHEVILVDASEALPDKSNYFKRRLYDRFGLRSDQYEHDPEYNFYINAAEPSYLALKAVVGNNSDGERFVVAHEVTGLPLLYSTMLHAPEVYHPVFFAHGVATMRSIVEKSYGHDTMFYNTLRRASAQGLFLQDVFGDQSSFFKHAMLKTIVECDNILAVGDLTIEELRFLSSVLAQTHVDLVYNGLSSIEITLEDKLTSKHRLAQYAVNLGLFKEPPDYVFTHVTRFVTSKAMWRDVRVLECLDDLLVAQDKSAVLFVLATAIPSGRPTRSVRQWEEEYGWPVVHHQGNGDLMRDEIDFYRLIDFFNAQAKATRVVLVNQFGWNRERCGQRMPADMNYKDIRWGTDLEFGQSIYEPFGIAQVEPLSFGALCVVSNVCGCIGLIRRAAGGRLPENLIVADYTTVPEDMVVDDYKTAQVIGQPERDRVEANRARTVAQEIMARLPAGQEAQQRLLEQGYQLARKMDWDVVIQEHLLPALVYAANR